MVGSRTSRPVTAVDPRGLVLKELILAYFHHTEGLSEIERDKVRLALKPLRELFGEVLAREFGPLRFKTFRTSWSRQT